MFLVRFACCQIDDVNSNRLQYLLENIYILKKTRPRQENGISVFEGNDC